MSHVAVCMLGQGEGVHKRGQMEESGAPGHLPWGFPPALKHPGLEILLAQESGKTLCREGSEHPHGGRQVLGACRNESKGHVPCCRGHTRDRDGQGLLRGVWGPESNFSRKRGPDVT